MVRQLPQLRLPVDFWTRDDVRRTLTERDLGALFRLVAKWGTSQTQIAIAVGMTQGQVSTIIAGSRKVSALDVVERVLDGLSATDDARILFGLAPRGSAAPALPGQPQAPEADEAATEPETAEEIAARSRLLQRSDIGEPQLAYLERAADEAIQGNERRAPADLLPLVRELRRRVDQLLAGQQRPRQRLRLYTTAVKLSGLLGSLCLDLGRWQLARAYGLEAFELAELVERPDLQSWARATQSLIEYYAGNYHDALALAQDGQRIASGGPQSVRLVLNGEARALARLGDAPAVEIAVDRGFGLLEQLPRPGGVSVSLSLDTYCEARAAANAATALLTIGRPSRVHEFAGLALASFDAAGLRGPQALSRIDQAAAWLMGDRPDPERACGLVKEALSYVPEAAPESVVQRSREFIGSAAAWRRLPAVREVGELVAGVAARHGGSERHL